MPEEHSYGDGLKSLSTLSLMWRSLLHPSNLFISSSWFAIAGDFYGCSHNKAALPVIFSTIMGEKLYFTFKFMLLPEKRPLKTTSVMRMNSESDALPHNEGCRRLQVFPHQHVLLLLSWHLTQLAYIIQQGAVCFVLLVMTASCTGKHYDLTSQRKRQWELQPVIFTDCFPAVSSPLVVSPCKHFSPLSLLREINSDPWLSPLYISWLLVFFPSNLQGHLVPCPCVWLQYLCSLNPFDKINRVNLRQI